MESQHNNNNNNNIAQHTNSRKFDRCLFAKTCNGGDGIMFPTLFCGETVEDYSDKTTSSTEASNGWTNQRWKWYDSVSRALLIVGLSLILLMLFRLLNSTTDEFFSPGLELFSLHLGLPPRFAGVVSVHKN